MSRVETGPLQIDDDWPGVFIRGDNALMGYVPALDVLIAGRASPIDMAVCRGLLRTLRSSGVVSGVDPEDLQVVRTSDADQARRQDPS